MRALVAARTSTVAPPRSPSPGGDAAGAAPLDGHTAAPTSLGSHLALVEEPDPVPGPGQVLIRVRAAGVNRADLLQARGTYDPPPGASPVLGLECSGVVEAVGPGRSRWAVGDEVCALVAGGACADLCLAEEGLVLPLPLPSLNPAADPRFTPGFSPLSDQTLLSRGLDPALAPHVLAALLVEASATTWMALVTVGGLSTVPEENAGRCVLVHGGTGSVGSIALQVACALGVKVLATAGSPQRAVDCVSLGAHAALDRHDDLVPFVEQHTDGRGVDLVLDVAGGPSLGTNVAVLARGGVLVVIGLLGGSSGELDLSRMLVRDLTVRATTLRSRTVPAKAEICAALETHVWPLVRRGLVRPVFAGLAPLTGAATVHDSLVRGRRVGGWVLLP